ncbi:hypothetical protein GGR56DRAFT_253608 [Xylariaceae sp. FL0804]|nr:hypothetical protein GGR56DRAFT_253608 [Xylariaceae sp. FL0804]
MRERPWHSQGSKRCSLDSAPEYEFFLVAMGTALSLRNKVPICLVADREIELTMHSGARRRMVAAGDYLQNRRRRRSGLQFSPGANRRSTLVGSGLSVEVGTQQTSSVDGLPSAQGRLAPANSVLSVGFRPSARAAASMAAPGRALRPACRGGWTRLCRDAQCQVVVDTCSSAIKGVWRFSPSAFSRHVALELPVTRRIVLLVSFGGRKGLASRFCVCSSRGFGRFVATPLPDLSQ